MHHGSCKLWPLDSKQYNSWTDDPQHCDMPLEFPNSNTWSFEVYRGRPSIFNMSYTWVCLKMGYPWDPLVCHHFCQFTWLFGGYRRSMLVIPWNRDKFPTPPAKVTLMVIARIWVQFLLWAQGSRVKHQNPWAWCLQDEHTQIHIYIYICTYIHMYYV
jgi:hypothetical protein